MSGDTQVHAKAGRGECAFEDEGLVGEPAVSGGSEEFEGSAGKDQVGERLYSFMCIDISYFSGSKYSLMFSLALDENMHSM